MSGNLTTLKTEIGDLVTFFIRDNIGGSETLGLKSVIYVRETRDTW